MGHRYQSLADYHAVDVGELSVGEGQIVEVVKVSNIVRQWSHLFWQELNICLELEDLAKLELIH